MSTHNICFCGEIRKMPILSFFFFVGKVPFLEMKTFSLIGVIYHPR